MFRDGKEVTCSQAFAAPEPQCARALGWQGGGKVREGAFGQVMMLLHDLLRSLDTDL